MNSTRGKLNCVTEAAQYGSRQLMLVAPEQLVWKDLPGRPLEPGELQVKTLRSAVSVGSEYAWFIGSERPGDLRPGSRLSFPRRMGYESLGIVTASRSERAQPGDRIIATYGHRTSVVLGPNDLLIRIPPEIPDEVAILSILSCEASRGAERASCGMNDPILITGAGAIGLLALHRLRWLGFQDITVVDPRPDRRHLAEQFGASHALTDADLPRPGQFAFGLECSSVNIAFRLLQQSMRRLGSIAVLADGNYGPLDLDPLANELTIQGSSDGTDYEQYAHHFFAYWNKHPAPLASLFEQVVS